MDFYSPDRIPYKPTNCASVDPDLFFEDEDAEIAKALCADCWFREECLQGALEAGEEYGVWGGVQLNPVTTFATTEERDKALIEAIRDGMSKREVAAKFDMPRTTILSILTKKAPDLVGPASKSRVAEILALWDEGLHQAEIARRLKVHNTTVSVAINKHRADSYAERGNYYNNRKAS